MHSDPVITSTIFFGLFFVVISSLQFLSQKISFPYTVSLLIVGLIAQFVANFLGLEQPIELSTGIIFFILLPLLLFDSAMRINFHQFRLHFRTITFLTTFGLFISITSIAVLLTLILGIPIGYGFLFGALISATDPIAVVSIFKSIRAPKRLALLIEGESMFNDATAVILFRMISGVVVAASALGSAEIIFNFGSFLYVFLGSIIFGGVAGYLSTRIINVIDNDHIIETTITVALALSVFIISEHFLGLSGVISTVLAGIIVGNVGRTTISKGVINFIDNLWEYVSFLAVSLVFFFATFALDITFFFENPIKLLIVALTTLVGRALSIYGTFFITNRVSFFSKEPNVPAKWQHILNWGGLRGVIPLVLVYSISDEFVFKSELISFTLATFLFTLFINGTTVKLLLTKLGIHLPKKEEEIIKEEEEIFEIEKAKQKLKKLKDNEFDKKIMKQIEKALTIEEKKHKDMLIKLSNTKEFLRSLKYQALQIERNRLNMLFKEGFIGEGAYFTFETQLDLQLDALEYPEVKNGRGYDSGGLLPSQQRFKDRIARLQRLSENYPLLAKIADVPADTLVKNRLSLLKTRLASTQSVLDYLKRIKDLFKSNENALRAISLVQSEYEYYLKKNKEQIKSLSKKYPDANKKHQEEVIYSFIKSEKTSQSSH